MPRVTLTLLRSVETGCVAGAFEELVELARLNKVLLGFLRSVKCESSLRALEEGRYSRFMSEVSGVVEALRCLDYALFKFRRPLEHVSVDIDVLVGEKHVREAVRRLRERGFRVEVLEPYTVTMVRGGTIVDLYTHPSFAWMVYLDGGRLLEEVETTDLDAGGVEAEVLSREAEAVVAAAHAVYKEHIYLLADYFVVKLWLNRRALRLAGELRAEGAVRVCVQLNELLERGFVEAPVKLDPARVTWILLGKFVKDPWFRGTSLNAARLTVRRRTVEQLIHRVKRKAY